MRSYSLTLVVSPDLKDNDRKKLLDTVSGLVKDSTNLKTEEWGQKPLTYPIKRQVAGYFAHFSFETETIPGDLEKKLLTADGVLRHLLLKVKTPKVEKKEANKSSKTIAEAEKKEAKTAKKKVTKTAVKKAAPKKVAKKAKK